MKGKLFLFAFEKTLYFSFLFFLFFELDSFCSAFQPELHGELGGRTINIIDTSLGWATGGKARGGWLQAYQLAQTAIGLAKTCLAKDILLQNLCYFFLFSHRGILNGARPEAEPFFRTKRLHIMCVGGGEEDHPNGIEFRPSLGNPPGGRGGGKLGEDRRAG